MTLRLGRITYANCTPFFYYLREAGFTGEIVSGVPAALNTLLAADQIDVSPSSSFEYARNWRRYVLLPDLSISADGDVRSVLLFSAVPPEALDPATPIAITGDSATSINLLRILLREYYGWDEVQTYIPSEPFEQLITSGQPALLIGDHALRCAHQLTVPSYDLSGLWQQQTGLPFVFALWIARRDIAEQDPASLRLLLEQLQQAKAQAFQQLPLLAKETVAATTMTEAQLIDYWRQIEYGLSASCLAGLQLYFNLAYKYGLLPELPEIRFAR